MTEIAQLFVQAIMLIALGLIGSDIAEIRRILESKKGGE